MQRPTCPYRTACSSQAPRLALLFAFVTLAIGLAADAPHYEECRLDCLFPAGGRVGETVEVDFFGNNGGLADAKAIIIDGPPGISVEKVENVNPAQVRATLRIQPDAAPGRRMLRVQSERSGLTNMLYFVVGRLPERTEKEPNHDIPTAESITLPLTVNGRINPAADVDCFAFEAKAGQRLVAVVFAHALDSHGQYKNFGLADASLRIDDAAGRIVAEAQDTLGLDPLAEFVVPADGKYTASVQLVAFRGFPEAVYRFSVGEIPIPTSITPVRGQRGASIDAEFGGPLIPANLKRPVVLSAEPNFPVAFATLDSPLATGYDLPLLIEDGLAADEVEPNQDKSQATPIALGTAVFGQFADANDQDWYRLAVKAGQKIHVETISQRYLRLPVDTFVQVFDANGKLLGENDDGIAIDYMSIHDYVSPDSQLTVSATTDGELLIRVIDQSGTVGPRSSYQLRAKEAVPDFSLYQFPDGVPIWGPGSTAALVVKVDRGPAGFEEDIELSVEGLPAGWQGGSTTCPGKQPHFGKHRFLTITAPADAAVGTLVPFRVVGRARIGDKTIERVAQPMTLYYSSDTGFFRITPVSRAVVAKPQGPWLSATSREFTVTAGGTVDIPVNVHGLQGETSLALVPNAGMINVGCGLNAPRTVSVDGGIAKLPLTVSNELMPPGTYDVIVARSWRSDIRIGMPGPCTPPIRIHVTAK